MRQSANEAWVDLLRDIYENGRESAPRKLRIKELLCRTTQVDMARPIVTVKRRKLGYRFMAAEAHWILSGRNDVAGLQPYSKHIASFSDDGFRFDGAYGPRIVDQLRYVVDTLVTDPESRQAVMEIWRPNPRISKDVPCTLTTQWLIRDGHLHCIDTMRSSDAWLGFPYDCFNFSTLSAYILLMFRYRTGKALNLGTLYLTAGSSHLYLDGADNIPYTINDIREVLAEVDSGGPRDLSYGDRGQTPYEPLNVDQFNSPSHLLEHLELCKDLRGAEPWMREFQCKLPHGGTFQS